ncbi:glutaredoxin family protein [Bacillus carboniphilus]|uniref:Glutaredoxin family protein n=1 Tax=Bacillus carboniphilus TaxID=86663 RepID=A0ABY9JPT7_9BACI|nr:glutaredoxin family protein [Bacillus carboniphilus]WLR41425.1 glutaredoxin family protein [Bacillus carboniphilus]
MNKKKLVMYSKDQCHLCKKAKEAVQPLLEEFDLIFEEIDIYQDDELIERYSLMIPVVEYEGEMLLYGQVTKDSLRKRLLKQMPID